MHLVGGGVERGPLRHRRLDALDVVEIRVGGRHGEVEIVLVAIDLALAGLGQDDELVGEVAADRAGVGAHRDRLQPQPLEGPEIGDEHLVVGVDRAVLVEIEGIGVLHQELARAHGAEARPHLVAELPLQVVEVQRQVLVALHIGPEDLGDHLLVGRAEQHLAVVAVADAQHLLAIGVVAPALAPQVRRLDRGHQQFDGARAVLLLAHDLLHLVQDLQPQRQPGIDAGALLPDHAGAQHQAVGDDLGFLGRLAQDGQEIAGETHRGPRNGGGMRARSLRRRGRRN